jgi:hypothetical protein
MAGKIGTSELLALEYFHRRIKLPFPVEASWRRPAKRLWVDSGVFPVDKKQFYKFIEIYLQSIQMIDALYLWQNDSFLGPFEKVVTQKYCPEADLLGWGELNHVPAPELLNLRWLVISPFVETMRKQLTKIAEIHQLQIDPEKVRPKTGECNFLRCPPLSSLAPSPFRSWTDGFEKMKETALAQKFDIAIVGAGAWSLPLLAEIKKSGRKGLHLGGETQLLFGIKGRRWDEKGLYNVHWVRPSPEETPPNFMQKENGCYW